MMNEFCNDYFKVALKNNCSKNLFQYTFNMFRIYPGQSQHYHQLK